MTDIDPTEEPAPDSSAWQKQVREYLQGEPLQMPPSLASTSLSLKCKVSELEKALASLEDVFKRSPQVVERFLSACNTASELVRLDLCDSAAAAGELRIALQPSDRLLHFLSTAVTRDVDSL